MTTVSFSLPLCCSFDDGDFDDAEEDEGLDDLENPEDVRLLSVQGYTLCYSKKNVSVMSTKAEGAACGSGGRAG